MFSVPYVGHSDISMCQWPRTASVWRPRGRALLPQQAAGTDCLYSIWNPRVPSLPDETT